MTGECRGKAGLGYRQLSEGKQKDKFIVSPPLCIGCTSREFRAIPAFYFIYPGVLRLRQSGPLPGMPLALDSCLCPLRPVDRMAGGGRDNLRDVFGG